MYRTRIERLEERKMFSVTDLIIDPFVAQSVSPATVDEAPAIVDYLDGSTYSDPGRFNLVGDFNGDGLDDLASFTVDSRPGMTQLTGDFNRDGRDDLAAAHARASATIAAGPSNLIIVVCNRGLNDSNLLPYVEQDNIYKLSDYGRDAEASSFVAALYTDLLGRPVNRSALASITDGSSNTLLFNATSVNVPPIDLDLLGALVDTSPINLSVVSLDTWEHAYSLQGEPTTNGIIAILIGLAADPADATGNTALGANFAMIDGSVKFIGTDVTGTAQLGAPRPSLLASDEFFARFSNTTLDDAPYNGRPNR